MKNIKIKYVVLSLLVAFGFTITACVEDDFAIPQVGVQEPIEIDGTVISISALLGELAQNDGEITSLAFFEDIYVEGYIVSSDEGGNFFKELWMQDKPENPTTAVRIAVDIPNTFSKYNVGRKLYVKLDGLGIGFESGNPSIGIINGDRIGRIPSLQAESDALIRDNIVEEIIAKEVEISQINASLIGQFIKIPYAQFPMSRIEDEETFASGPFDQFDVEKPLESCLTNASILIGTSTFSDFKAVRLPAGAGEISGVFLRSFGNSDNLLKINTVEDINFDQDRCDPEPLCEGPSGGPDVIFEEDFEGITNIAQLNGWINVNTEGGTLNWRTGSFSNNTYAQVSGFNSGQTYDAWLVTPEINLSNSSLEQISIDMEAAFDNGRGLSVLITENYTGDVLTTEWQEMENIEVPQGPGSGFGGLSPAGVENISCLENIRVAFRYQGSDPNGVTTRYHVDNVRIVGEAN